MMNGMRKSKPPQALMCDTVWGMKQQFQYQIDVTSFGAEAAFVGDY